MIPYRLVTYQAGGAARAGMLVRERIFDIAASTGKPEYASMLGILDDWPEARERLRAAAEVRSAGREGIALADAMLLAPLPRPRTIFCAGNNYTDHAAEMARFRKTEPEPEARTLGLAPWHFIKASQSVVGPGASIRLPSDSRSVDWEIELAAVIGRPAKNVSVEEALGYVAGYTIANDLSARDLGRRPHLPETSAFKRDWVSHKCFDGACPLGPWLVPADEVPNPQDLALKLSVNGAMKQNSTTRNMVFSVAEQIAFLSSRITLSPGDIILTGTPAGVGAPNNDFLRPGDVLRLSIERIGELVNVIAS